MNPSVQRILLCFAITLSACGDSEEPLTTLVSSAPADAATCPDGGTSISVGSDANGNGALESSEIDSTTAVCSVAPSGLGDALARSRCSFHVNISELNDVSVRFDYDLLVFDTNASFQTASVKADGENPVTAVEFSPPRSDLDTAIYLWNDVFELNDGGEFFFEFDIPSEVLSITYQDVNLDPAVTLQSDEFDCSVSEIR